MPSNVGGSFTLLTLLTPLTLLTLPTSFWGRVWATVWPASDNRIWWLIKQLNFGILDLRVSLIRPTSTSAWNCIFFLDCCGSFVHFYDSQFFFLCQYERTLQLRVWRSQCLDSLLGGDLLSGIALLYNKTKMFNKHCNASLYNTLSFRRYSTCTHYWMEWGGTSCTTFP